MEQKKHVLVLMCDQMQAQRLGAVDAVAHTPNLDRLAAEGVHCSHLISAHGQCVPSRASFVTGLFPHECGVMVNYGFHGHQGRLTRRYRTLGHVFSEAGYRTVYFGKCHFGVSLAELGFAEGRDYDGVKIDDAEAARLGMGHVPAVLRRDYLAAREAAAFLRDFDDDGRPLFFIFSTNLPHPPFFNEPEFADLFAAEGLELPPSYYAEDFSTKPAFHREHAEDERHGAGSEAAAREELAQYYSMIAATDAHMGTLMDIFRQRGMWDQTLALFFADHGDMMAAHHTRLKGTLPYEEIYRVPCLIKLPQGTEPVRRRVDDLLSSVQLAGTLVRGAGLEVAGHFHHGDFYEALFSPQAPAKEQVFFEHYAAYWGTHPFYGVRRRDYKFVRYYGPDASTELYDLAADPHELKNVAATAAYVKIERDLAAEADAWWRNTGGRDFDYYDSEAFKANRHNLESV
jgi:arylsulfatase